MVISFTFQHKHDREKSQFENEIFNLMQNSNLNFKWINVQFEFFFKNKTKAEKTAFESFLTNSMARQSKMAMNEGFLYFVCDICWWGHLEKSAKVTATVCLFKECTGRRMVHRVHKLILQKTLHRYTAKHAGLFYTFKWKKDYGTMKSLGKNLVAFTRSGGAATRTRPVLLRGGYLILCNKKFFFILLTLIKTFQRPHFKEDSMLILPCDRLKIENKENHKNYIPASAQHIQI